MSAHWTTDSCTLFTIVVYYRHEEELRHLNYTMVSELSHTKDAVITFNKVLLDDLKEQLPFPVRHVHYWSDGAGSQLRTGIASQTCCIMKKTSKVQCNNGLAGFRDSTLKRSCGWYWRYGEEGGIAGSPSQQSSSG